MIELHCLQQFLVCTFDCGAAGPQPLQHRRAARFRVGWTRNARWQEENSRGAGGLQGLYSGLNKWRVHPNGDNRLALQAEDRLTRVAFRSTIRPEPCGWPQFGGTKIPP